MVSAENLFHRLNCVFERLGQTCKKFSEDSCCEEIEFFFLSRGRPFEIFKGECQLPKGFF